MSIHSLLKELESNGMVDYSINSHTVTRPGSLAIETKTHAPSTHEPSGLTSPDPKHLIFKAEPNPFKPP